MKASGVCYSRSFMCNVGALDMMYGPLFSTALRLSSSVCSLSPKVCCLKSFLWIMVMSDHSLSSERLNFGIYLTIANLLCIIHSVFGYLCNMLNSVDICFTQFYDDYACTPNNNTSVEQNPLLTNDFLASGCLTLKLKSKAV